MYLFNGAYSETFGTSKHVEIGQERRTQRNVVYTKQMDVNQLAKEIVKYVGGKKNIVNLVHCATRLRFTLSDNEKINVEELEKLDGVLGLVNNSAQPQIIIGNKVHEVCEAIYKQIGMTGEEKVENKKKDGNIFMRAIMIVPKVFTPVLPAFVACGLLKALFSVLQITGVMDASSSTYQILNFASDVAFYFLPILIAVSAAKVFNANTYMAIAIVAMLLHPTFAQMVQTGEAVSFLGLPVPLVNYGSSLIPAILGVWVLSYVEKFFYRYIPEILRFVFAPLLTFLTMLVIMFVVIGPLGYDCGTYLAKAMISLYDTAGIVAIVLIAVLKPFLVLAGMHYALAAAFLPVFVSTGVDAFYMVTSILPNLGQAGAAFGVFLRSKDKKVKSIALSTSFSAFMGITEPALFGVNLKYRRPMIGAMTGAGVGALYAAIMGVKFIAMANFGIFGILGVMPKFMLHMVIAVIITLVVSTVITYILGIDETKKKEVLVEKEETNKEESSKIIDIHSPVRGQIVPLSQVSDEAFRSEAIGKGIAVLPEEGKVYAPVDGEVTALFQTGHALGLTTKDGVELLIHVGIDTVSLNGKYFQVKVSQGSQVKKGDLLLEFDKENIEKEGYQTVTPILVTNIEDYLDILPANQKQEVKVGEPLLKIMK